MLEFNASHAKYTSHWESIYSMLTASTSAFNLFASVALPIVISAVWVSNLTTVYWKVSLVRLPNEGPFSENMLFLGQPTH